VLAEGDDVIFPFLEQGPPMMDLLRRLSGTNGFVGRILTASTEDDAGLGSYSPEAPVDRLLTRRESQILGYVAEGLSNKEIALELSRSVETVKKHIYNTYKKLDADNRISALARARCLGIPLGV
jgi:DNA-binding NarL/FixJ family response regulator